MSDTHTCHHYHIVFTTKDREPWLGGEAGIETRRYLCGVLASIGVRVVRMDGMPDHLHLLCRVPPTVSVSELVQKAKANSSRWYRQRFGRRAFAWQRGFASFTVSYANVEAVSRYIDRQEQHHRKRTFAEELQSFLARHDMPEVGSDQG